MDLASDALKKESYKAGDFIFFEGDIESHFYIIEKGQVQIFTKNQFGKRIDIINVEEGESFGEFALLDHKPRSASAQALTDVNLVRVSPEGYESLLNDLPVWATSMMRSFIRRLKSMNEILKETDQFLPRK